MLTRRALLWSAPALIATGSVAGATTFVVSEASFGLAVTRYDVKIAGWGSRPPLTLCAVADLHAGAPWMTLERVGRIVETANALRPDLMVILGDLPAHYPLISRAYPPAEIAAVLADLHAPLGRFAILGNHDWWDDPRFSGRDRFGPPGEAVIRSALERAGIPVLINQAALLPHGAGVWLLGTDSGWVKTGDGDPTGPSDLGAALAMVHDNRPAVLLSHEPDIFPSVPDRIGLTLCGHTHGGQVRPLGQVLAVPSRYGSRYAYGYINEGGRQMVVSGGLGCSKAPIRLGMPPELTVVTLS